MVFEKDIESFLTREAERRGGLCLKFGQDGWPDRILTLPGSRVVWVELKRPGGEESALQKLRAAQLRRSGQEVCTVWNRGQAQELLDRLLPGKE